MEQKEKLKVRQITELLSAKKLNCIFKFKRMEHEEVLTNKEGLHYLSNEVNQNKEFLVTKRTSYIVIED